MAAQAARTHSARPEARSCATSSNAAARPTTRASSQAGSLPSKPHLESPGGQFTFFPQKSSDSCEFARAEKSKLSPALSFYLAFRPRFSSVTPNLFTHSLLPSGLPLVSARLRAFISMLFGTMSSMSPKRG